MQIHFRSLMYLHEDFRHIRRYFYLAEYMLKHPHTLFSWCSNTFCRINTHYSVYQSQKKILKKTEEWGIVITIKEESIAIGKDLWTEMTEYDESETS